jgi:hypothetical protein
MHANLKLAPLALPARYSAPKRLRKKKFEDGNMKTQYLVWTAAV